MNSATLKSIVLFLLNDVDVKTNENAIELFERWRKTTHYCVKDPLEVKWCLECIIFSIFPMYRNKNLSHFL